MRRGTPKRWGAARQVDSGAFFLEHPYRGAMPEIHEVVLAWLLGDDEADPERPPIDWNRPTPRPA